MVAGLDHDAGSELAWLDAAAHPNRPLEAGHVLRLPLWCAGKLHDYGHVTLALPEMFSDGPRRDMDADASHLNLRECCDWYFETGRELAGRLNDESLLETLSRGFVARFHKLLGAALSASSRVDTTAQKAKLTRVERALFDAGQHAKRSADAWRLARNAKLEASKFAARRRKRKAGAGDI
ncbi:hypothetical protein EMIHUDRAFT_445546 [Emiliania huxleyi CCMP1516]|uniref:DNA replication complex GINS protein PSF3 n=2 Tax=Emiliania huxleyi TaxID=2903 RepID=A0A0D3IWY1_EMIH1|nr:hypothetical protein EMIHUDRAFT_445546 [Emiliania huxleyi CCMP1516]EOD15766.1 hypothetical protein EMIHUDRAFT_445546 [Emiliania huxleyi CCMP1516]|eukprot:XP_005768195.1 hypothetical protein EMIHUDRAFT_445546 [Emiliania huxleyi CCMP1516]